MKTVVPISGQLLELFAPLLPGKLSLSHQILLGCLEDSAPLGCAVVERYGLHCCLSWLLVDPLHRRQGVGSLLLTAACRAALEEPGADLEYSYEPEAPWAIGLDGMTAARGGLLRTQELPCFRLPAEALSSSPLLHGLDPQTIHAPNIIPLNQLTPYQLKVLRHHCEQQGVFNVSRAAFELADPWCSMILMDRQQAMGLTLIRRLKPQGMVSLDLLYLDKQLIAQGLALLRQTAAALLTADEPLRELRMVCVNESSEAIGLKLLGRDYLTTQPLRTAQFSQEFYLPGISGDQ